MDVVKNLLKTNKNKNIELQSNLEDDELKYQDIQNKYFSNDFLGFLKGK